MRGLSLVIWRGLAVGGGLKIGGQREGILWSTKHSERISCIQLLGLQHPSYSAVLQTPKYPPPTMKEGGGHKVWENISKS